MIKTQKRSIIIYFKFKKEKKEERRKKNKRNMSSKLISIKIYIDKEHDMYKKSVNGEIKFPLKASSNQVNHIKDLIKMGFTKHYACQTLVYKQLYMLSTRLDKLIPYQYDEDDEKNEDDEDHMKLSYTLIDNTKYICSLIDD